ncbi:ELM1/GtrOC1 family putative glycosyltransferase [Acinetobacter sp. Marseille-Q1623]|uniref:ELM1/GtrOC1 family putative glycosyltransferase n=1 Tax=Acinetobacter sp. Marseille-Q1623 TaxID=2697501 RepID=UPI00157A74BD|nr:ELM1/GtrOC1 family putative glycosyltransferase [Acinetobacter sp. Marseille-Q1623]
MQDLQKPMILAITDGRPGHETQTQGICTILNRDQKYLVEYIKIKTISKFKKKILMWGFKFFSKSWMLGQIFDLDEFEDMDIDSIEYIVSAGGDTLLANALLKVYLSSVDVPAKNIIATSLRGMPASAFDAVFTIDENKAGRSPFIYYPIAPNKLLSFNLDKDEQGARQKLNLKSGTGVWSVLIGADSHDVSIGSVEDWIIMLENLAQNFSADEFFISTSRRTPKLFEQALKNVLKQYKNVHLILVGEGDKTPVKDLMYAANIIICSPDSTSMVSESLMLQKPVLIAHFASTRLNSEFEKYYADKKNRGWIKFYSPEHFDIQILNDFKYEYHAIKLEELIKAQFESNNL